MQLLLVRHGRPHQVDGHDQVVDPALDDLGLAQAQAVAVALSSGTYGRVTGVASSTMRRALETARPTAEALGLRVQTDQRLVELDDGATRYGNGFSEHATRAEAWAAINAGRWNGHVFDPAAFTARVVEGMLAVADASRAEQPAAGAAEGTLAVFCHGGVISAFLGHVARTAQPLFVTPDHGSVTRILLEPDGYLEVLSVNERSHLHESSAPAGGVDRRPEAVTTTGAGRQ
jgi:probable phosphoglycerate mutase